MNMKNMPSVILIAFVAYHAGISGYKFSPAIQAESGGME
jgi:hypothetical protein